MFMRQLGYIIGRYNSKKLKTKAVNHGILKKYTPGTYLSLIGHLSDILNF